MTKHEAAAYIRATFPIFRAHPEQWCKYDFMVKPPGKPVQFCAIGGALAIRTAENGETFTLERYLPTTLGWDGDGVRSADAFEDALDEDGNDVYQQIIDANNDSTDVEDMIQNVEAVLVKAGL